MVSALWNACAEGDDAKVSELLNEASVADIEIKDHNGVTPLIQAIENGHVQVVEMLLAKGADPTNPSVRGPPEQHTSNPAILDLLNVAKLKMIPNGMPSESGYAQGPANGYRPPPPGPYYYPGMPAAPPVLHDGMYYPSQPPPPGDHNAGGVGNLPPPEVARLIPCRYYPACRYGTSCMFAHPPGPYLQGPLPPPAQYPTPYDPMAPAPYPHYYPPSFQTAPNGLPMNPMSPPPGPSPVPLGHPHPPPGHARSSSELVTPIQGPFSPSGPPPPMQYGVVSPVSPSYPHPGPPLPLSIPPLPPLQHPSGPSGPQSPQHVMYTPTSPGAQGPIPPQFAVRQDPYGQHYPQDSMPANIRPEAATSPKSPINLQGEGPAPVLREFATHHRRGSARRPSFGGIGRKPPCLFFPSGRCRNGDDCRFPHVLPDAAHVHGPPHFSARGGHRPRSFPHANGVAVIEDKFAALAVQDQNPQPPVHRNGTNGSDSSSRSQSTEPGVKAARGPHGPKPNHFAGGARPEKRPVAPLKPQRLPSADEFPVLTGASTPPLRSPAVNSHTLNGHSGPTAAQVLQAPAPSRKDSQPGTRGGSPDLYRSSQQSKDKPDSDGIAASLPQEQNASKLPVSFAAVATAASDAAKEVSVSA